MEAVALSGAISISIAEGEGLFALDAFAMQLSRQSTCPMLSAQDLDVTLSYVAAGDGEIVSVSGEWNASVGVLRISEANA